MFEGTMDWVRNVLGAKYEYLIGEWADDDQSDGNSFCVLRNAGGAPPGADRRSMYIDILLVGPKGKRWKADEIRKDAELIMQHITLDNREIPCGSANIRALSEPVGPGYTTENRAWYTLTFEVLF